MSENVLICLLFVYLFLERDARYNKWKMAIQRSLGWASVKMSEQMTGKDWFFTEKETEKKVADTKEAFLELAFAAP